MQHQGKISEEIQLLIIEFLGGTISNDNLLVLNKWIEEDEDHRLLFNEFKSVWLLSSKPVESSFSSDDALLKVKREIGQETKVLKLPFWNAYRIAASWVLIFCLGSAIAWFSSGGSDSKNSLASVTSFTAPIGSKARIDLPDGSTAWLNAGSKISYTNDFGKKSRRVDLMGEAFFEVKSDKENPFYVFTSHLVVKAVGTKFNVKAYPEENTITTTLEEGKVLLSGKAQQPQIISLKPSQKAIYNKSAAQNTGNKFEVKDNFATELVTSWKESVWILESEKLGSFAVLLERRYNVKIEFESDEVKNFKFTGKIQNESIEQILRAMELTAPIRYTIERNVIHIFLSPKTSTNFNNTLIN